MIRALLIDLDDTLLDEQTASRKGLEALWAMPRAVRDESFDQALARWRHLTSVHWKKFEEGSWTFIQQRRARIREFLGQDFDGEEADRLWEVYSRAYKAAWIPVPGCYEFLVRTASIPRVLVTNGQRDSQLEKLRRTRLDRWFPQVVTPFEAGAWKPDPAFFRYALGLLENSVPDLAAEEVLMIGDDPVRDIEPAQALGLSTFRVVPGDRTQSLEQAVSLLF